MQYRRLIVRVAVAGLPVWSTHQRNQQLRKLGMMIAPDAYIRPGVLFRNTAVTIGAAVYVGDRCIFDGGGTVVLGDRVYLAAGCMLLTHTHQIGPASQRAGDDVVTTVTIGAGSWLGAGVTVQPGVTVGTGCVVLPGAVVAADLAPNGLYGGVPAKLVRHLP